MDRSPAAGGKEQEAELLRDFSDRAINSIMDAILVIDIKGYTILSVNKAFLDALGLREEAVLGKTCYEITHNRDSPCIPPSDPCPITELLKTGKPSRLEHVHLNKDDQERFVEVSAYPIYEDERISKVVHITRDITEQKRAEEALRESEEKFRGLAEYSPNMIFINKMGKVVYANKKCEEVMGYTKKEFYSEDFDFLGLIAPDSRDLVKENLRKHVEGKEIQPYEYKLLTKEGREIIAIHTTKLIDYEGGKAILGIVTDITERKQAEEELKKYARELERSNQLKDLFTDILRHDLLSPAGIIMNLTELMLEEAKGEAKQDLQAIQRNIKKMIELIESASKLSKLESLDELDMKRLSLKKLIDGVVEDSKPLLDDAGLKVINNVKGRIWIKASPVIGDVFINLLSNAVKYAAEGEKVVVEASAEDESIKVIVKDYGPGIPDKEKEVVFGRFMRRKKKGVKGTGLGLAIAKRIVDLHRGRIWVEDNKPRGSVFVVQLPKEEKHGSDTAG